MDANELDKYRFPKTLRHQRLWFGLPADEFIPIVTAIGWGVCTGHYLFGLLTPFLFFMGIRKIKEGRGSCWLRDLAYWYLPTSLLKGLFQTIPPSCFRQWTK
ncbi:type IV conjugative transfer system protein TraL [Sodalis endosymbiont of Spalangia cameroni]|uniref:type IV conjugative transfer system protein TraL n=1 Tax=Sodalis praecaptivus TaxID=1239307 RepID=UPI0031F7280A